MSVPSQVDKLKERMKILDSMDEKLKNIEEFIKQLKAYEGEKKTEDITCFFVAIL